ncbi:unnamed protein product [Rhizophagus irregularis]|nr:unnamed protein product [Rhizophagus irregularis]
MKLSFRIGLRSFRSTQHLWHLKKFFSLIQEYFWNSDRVDLQSLDYSINKLLPITCWMKLSASSISGNIQPVRSSYVSCGIRLLPRNPSSYTLLCEYHFALNPVSSTVSCPFSKFCRTNTRPSDDALRLINEFRQSNATVDDEQIGHLYRLKGCLKYSDGRVYTEMTGNTCPISISSTIILKHDNDDTPFTFH